MNKFKKIFNDIVLPFFIITAFTFALNILSDIKASSEKNHEEIVEVKSMFVELENVYYENIDAEAEAELRKIYTEAERVLNTLYNEGIYTPEEIIEYLLEKPAGITNLSAGVNNEVVYPELEKVYNGLAKNSKIAYGN